MKFLLVLLIFIKYCSSGSYNGPYLIFVGQNYSDVQNLTIDSNFNSINAKYFNPSKQSVLIIHGFEGSYETVLGTELVDAFLTRPEYNIIFADWSANANGAYFNVVYVIADVAEIFIQLLNKIRASGYDLTKIYIIGHSLGAHLAGKIGNLLQSQNIMLPRITGLDPAGPLFNWAALIMKIFGPSIHFKRFKPLFKGDAKFVDIIHSNAGWYRGLIFSTGDMDFWPNGGSFQPTCTGCGFLNLFQNLYNCSSCNHRASLYFYSESVRSSRPIFTSVSCPTGTIFKSASSCREQTTASMGFHASSSSQSGEYYLTTRAVAPYSYWI